MKNARHIENQETKLALQIIADVFEKTDHAGGVYLINPDEMAFLYCMPTSWSAFNYDPSTDLGFNIKARQDQLGPDEAKRLIDGAAFTIMSMIRFGQQTKIWGTDLKQMLEQGGRLKIETTPFPNIQHLFSIDRRNLKR